MDKQAANESIGGFQQLAFFKQILSWWVSEWKVIFRFSDKELFITVFR